MQKTIITLEESQETLNRQIADFNELQNQVLEFTSIIEELKQKNSDLENTINDLRTEMKTQ